MKSFYKVFLLVLMLTLFSFSNEKGRDLTKAEIAEAMKSSIYEMPSAGALVEALTHNLGDVKWANFVTNINTRKYKSLEDRVLNLGARGADAYFLTKSKDITKLIPVSIGINGLLNRIRLNKKSLNNRSRKAKLERLKKLVKKGKWKAVQREIDKLQNGINNDFRKSNSKHLELLNNIGGWIEGYRLAVEGFNAHYKKEATEILFQDELIGHLYKELQKNKKLKSFSKISSLLKILKDVRSVLSKSKNYKLSKKQIEDLLKNLSTIKKYI